MSGLSTISEHWLYPASFAKATEVQHELARRVIRTDALPGTIQRIGGVDVSNNLDEPETVYAAVVSLGWPGLAIEETATLSKKAAMPYQPGFLAFREVPALVEAFMRLSRKPDLLMVDGHGISHPRGLGIASHLGVLLDIPAIGVAKKILVGKLSGELAPEPGASIPLVWRGETIAMALRTRKNSNPVFVSTGHRVGLETAVDLVNRSLNGYKLPEPTRQAHLAANEYRKACKP